jgi:hypothetical protein
MIEELVAIVCSSKPLARRVQINGNVFPAGDSQTIIVSIAGLVARHGNPSLDDPRGRLTAISLDLVLKFGGPCKRAPQKHVELLAVLLCSTPDENFFIF